MITHAVGGQSIGIGSHMRSSDAFFWYGEAALPRMRPLVAGLFTLDRSPDRARFRASMERLVVQVPRLRQRVAESSVPFILPRWEAAADFDLDYHVREIVLPQPGQLRTLLQFCATAFATPLDHLRPLWEAYLIHGVEGRRAALFLKVHHAVMDGGGSIALFGALTQEHRAERVVVPRISRTPAPVQRSEVRTVTSDLRDLARVSVAAGRSAMRQLAAMATDPEQGIETLRQVARAARSFTDDLAAAPMNDPLVDRCTGIGRRLEVLTLALPRMQRIKQGLGVTLNDLVLAAVCGALRAYYEQHALPLHELRCQVPVNLRQDHERLALGNRVGALNVMLPLNELKPLARVQRIQEQTARAKQRRDGQSYGWLMRAATVMPTATLRLAAESARGRIHLICSNVPGPSVVRYLAGAKIESVHPFAPILLGLPLSIALMSYGKTLCVGLDSDPVSIPDPERLAQLLEREVDRLENRAVPRRVRVATRRRPAPPLRTQQPQRLNGHLREGTFGISPP